MSRNKRPSVSSLFSRPQAVQAMQSIAGVQREGRAPLALPAQGCPPHRRIPLAGTLPVLQCFRVGNIAAGGNDRTAKDV